VHRLGNFATRLTLGLAALAAAGSTPAGERIPVLLELFTSEGCSSCPPADRLLATFDEKQPEAQAELIVLSEHVDYFNYLGWKDPFSTEVFTARQESFSGKPNFDGGAYTPQLIVDGRFGFVGSDDGAAVAAIRKAVQQPKIPLAIAGITRTGGNVSVRITSAGDRNLKTARARLFVALAEDHLESRVLRGENAGHLLRHVAVTRVLKYAGTIDIQGPSATEVAIPLQREWGANGLRVVAFIQDASTGYVLGVNSQKLKF
jgi:hypothetical protein